MKTLLTALLLVVISPSVKGQDIIYFRSGDTVTCKVLEISEEYIRYIQVFPNSKDSIGHTVKSSRVAWIKFSNGQREIIAGNKVWGDGSYFRRNSWAFNPLGLVVGNIHFNYERLSKTGKFGIRTHLFVTFTYELNDWGVIGSGLDFNFYPSGQYKSGYFLGPAFRVGMIDYEPDKNFFVLLFNNGFTFWNERPLYLGIQVGAGGGFFENYKHKYMFYPYGYINFNIGKRF